MNSWKTFVEGGRIHLPLRRGLSLLSCDVWDGGTACDQKLGCVEEVWGTNTGLFGHALAYHLCIVYIAFPLTLSARLASAFTV